jgi:hypothetical protein
LAAEKHIRGQRTHVAMQVNNLQVGDVFRAQRASMRQQLHDWTALGFL